MKNINNIFKGKNILYYNSDEFSYQDIISYFFEKEEVVGKIVKEDNIRKKFFFNKNFKDNLISISAKSNHSGNEARIFINDMSSNKFKIAENDVPSIFGPGFGNSYNIKNISLLFPYIDTDPRLKSVNITSSSLFLGSMLASQNFNVDFSKMNLNNTDNCNYLFNADMIGYTLFEDSFVEFKSFIHSFSYGKNSIQAAGGPLITLNPIQSIYHLPEINLFIRGESEFCLPKILNLLNKGIPENLLSLSGLFFQIPGMIVISDFDKVNFPTNFSSLNFNFDFYKEFQISNGLEINFSRGCSKSCIFCSRVQGKKFRKLEILKIDELLVKFRDKLSHYSKDLCKFRTININDDDILQDKEYAISVFNTLKKNEFTVWGIQSSISSFFNHDYSVNKEIINIISEDINFSKDKLVWIGTDTFLEVRGKRLGKIVPDKNKLLQLLEEFDKKKIYNYHYWISSDVFSEWEEFSDELLLIIELSRRFDYFRLLPHAPFIIPYPSTAAYRLISTTESLMKKIVYKKKFKSNLPVFNLNIVDRVETDYYFLNELLKNTKPDGREGFFNYLKSGNFSDALINAYIFIKKERLYQKSVKDRNKSIIEKTENKLYEAISKFI